MTELRGSLAGIGLPALVRFLMSLGKSGHLRLSHQRWLGEVILDRGQMIVATFGPRRGLNALERIVFALPAGEFSFVEGAPPGESDPELAANEPLAYLERLETQRTALTAVPSLDAVPRVELAHRPGDTEPIVLDRSMIQTLLAVDSRRTVDEIAGARGLVQTLDDLVRLADLGLIRFDTPAEGGTTASGAPAPPTAAGPATGPTPIEPAAPTLPATRTNPPALATPDTPDTPVSPDKPASGLAARLAALRSGFANGPATAANTAKPTEHSIQANDTPLPNGTPLPMAVSTGASHAGDAVADVDVGTKLFVPGRRQHGAEAEAEEPSRAGETIFRFWGRSLILAVVAIVLLALNIRTLRLTPSSAPASTPTAVPQGARSAAARTDSPQLPAATAAPTATAVPAATTVPAAVSEIPAVLRTVLDERFGDNRRGWAHDPEETAWIADGGYRLYARHPGRFVAVGAPVAGTLEALGPSRDIVVVTANFRKVGGPSGGGYGLIVRDQGPGPRDGINQGGRYYVLEVGDRGEYGIWRREQDRWVDLIPWTRSDAVRPGDASNELIVRTVGPRLTFVVNGVQVAQLDDTTLPRGGVGVFAGGDLNEVLLERLLVQLPG